MPNSLEVLLPCGNIAQRITNSDWWDRRIDAGVLSAPHERPVELSVSYPTAEAVGFRAVPAMNSTGRSVRSPMSGLRYLSAANGNTPGLDPEAIHHQRPRFVYVYASDNIGHG